MTIADEIIYGTQENVVRLLDAGEDVNAMDEYGLTPLIETVVVNRIEIAKVLLARGADVNQQDLTGRTALHWAVDNSNDAFCDLLLTKGGNTNAYTRAGEPVMVNPLLRRQEQLREKLMRHGASLPFAQDFINTKLLGHRFELQGEVDIVDDKEQFIEIEFSGFFLEFTLGLVRDSLVRYQNNFSARNLRMYFENIYRMIQALTVSSQLIQYQQHTMEIQNYKKEIFSLLEHDLLLIPVCYAGHAITFIRYKNFLAKCDRGENSLREGAVNIYKINRPELMTKDFIMGLLYKRQAPEFVQNGINRVLGLETVVTIPLDPQVTGNCSWANVDAAICAMLYLLLALDEGYDEGKCLESAVLFYCQWQEWDKDRALEECIQSFSYSSKARKASKVTILAAILFQACQFGIPTDMARAGKILSVLSAADYLPVLKYYVDVFAKNPSIPEQVHGKNLLEILDYFDVDLRGVF